LFLCLELFATVNTLFSFYYCHTLALYFPLSLSFSLSGLFSPHPPAVSPVLCFFKGDALAKEIKAVKYMELSAKSREGLVEVFQEAVQLVCEDLEGDDSEYEDDSDAEPASRSRNSQKQSKKNNCLLL
jgi:hypothetical protein